MSKHEHPPSDGHNLVSALSSVVDDLRQEYAEIGLRPYRVRSVRVRWSGGERHRGSAMQVFEHEFTPTPRVRGVSRISRQLLEAGDVERGTLIVDQISPSYTEDDIASYFHCDCDGASEGYIEVQMDGRDERDEPPVRRRYVVQGIPERRPDRFDWTVRLVRQDESRTRRGLVR